MEVYNYFHCYEQETDQRIRAIWEEFLAMELTHLQLWGDILRKYEGRDPEVLFGTTMNVEFKFTENKEYLQHVLDFQRDVRQRDHGYAMLDELPPDWPSFSYQRVVNEGGAPSEVIVNLQRDVRVPRLPEQRPGDELLERARELAVAF